MEGLNLITDGQTWWAIHVSCYPLNLGRGHLMSTEILILGHLHHLQTTSHHHGDKLLMNSCWNICAKPSFFNSIRFLRIFPPKSLLMHHCI
ncbi:hypothetical protein RHGRI_015787 [Rhododendron griersonianum]|uniref:Uncharacterized protein n=1 Tax=Rhododendron griersonianum TaxID=479676 RepID=A0AAV6JNH6_9ERIC|nr:hypothetical protein RHGRI_015787 [Rhododendron griersonianum]